MGGGGAIPSEDARALCQIQERNNNSKAILSGVLNKERKKKGGKKTFLPFAAFVLWASVPAALLISEIKRNAKQETLLVDNNNK